MSTLVLRIAAPLVSWPSPSRRRTRGTEQLPTYSALVGLARAALGLPRLEPGQSPEFDLVAAVRADQPGRALRDFHTVNPISYGSYRNLSAADAKKAADLDAAGAGFKRGNPVVSERHFRTDSVTTVFIDDPDQRLAAAFTAPGFAIAAGRKGCPLTFPFVLGTVEADLEDALAAVPTVGDAVRPVPAHLFQPPARLPVTRTATKWDDPAGSVGHEYRSRPRFHTQVTPPVVSDLFALLSHFGG
ncbi:type I-E CRISPR-associated protein Cas5/CasD [Nocardioides sp. GY 10113]|uniref:type I-E CRISPR-associated protein Cas5/CasD n=1 Tax=Nocardioides sp. GY 10113 TaxID=2569761 RepID=UPI001458E3B1|nr:type I-E CRISPR-associated protein Cas5/CasD [Nocardioides sp. GY 10113]